MRATSWLLALTAMVACGEPPPDVTPAAPARPSPAEAAAMLQIPTVAGVDEFHISPDGAYVVVNSFKRFGDGGPGQRTVWRAATGQALFTVPAGMLQLGATAAGAPRLVSVRKPGDNSKAEDDDLLEVFDADTGALVWHRPTRPTVAIAIDAHGVLYALGADHTLARWDLATGASLGELRLPIRDEGLQLSVSADGHTVLAGKLVYDLANQAVLASLDLGTARTGTVQLAPDGQTIAVADLAGGGDVALFDRHGARLRTLDGAGDQATLLADGTLLAFDQQRVTRWDVRTGARLAAFYLPDDTRLPPGRSLPIGAGGHAVVHQGDRLAILQLAAPRAPVELGHLGLPARPMDLAWSADGATLQIRVEGLGRDRHEDELDWDVAGRLSARLYAPGGRLERMIEAPQPLSEIRTIGTHWIAVRGTAPVIYLFDADTGEPRGTIAPGGQVGALAIRPDDRTLAVALEAGAIELWDLPSRHKLLDLAVWHGGWVAHAPDDPAASPAFALSHPPAPRPISAPPPQPARPAPACVPADDSLAPVEVAITDHTVTDCVGERAAARDPICFAATLGDEARPRLAPVPPLPAALTYVAHSSSDGDRYTLAPHAGRLDVCAPDGACRTIPAYVRSGPDQPDSSGDDMIRDQLAVSDDGALVAIRRNETSVIETWDVATAKMIARFAASFPNIRREEGFATTNISFLGHAVVADNTPCAGPCGTANLYTVRGKLISGFPTESSSAEPEHFHDDLWALHDLDNRLVVLDLADGRVVLDHKYGQDGQVAVSPDYIAAAGGGPHAGVLTIFDRQARKLAILHVPVCSATRT